MAPSLLTRSTWNSTGLGGFAMAASPSIVPFVGGTLGDATANSRRMQAITLGTNRIHVAGV
jgi:hypothetical protein